MSAGAVVGAQSASADVTAVSTVYKTGTDTTTNSTAASPSAPGGAVTGATHPGDTINWVVDYSNTTGAPATVDARDSLASAGAYVAGSLQLPPAQIPGQPYSPQFTVDGSTWQPGNPPAGAASVGFTGGAAPAVNGLQQQFSQPFQVPSGITVNQTGGDAYNGVVTQLNGQYQVYTTFHHNTSSGTLLCSTTTGGVCPGWPATNTYASTQAGAPIGTDPYANMVTAWQDGTFLVGTRLYWLAEQTIVDGTGKYPIGTMCVDIQTRLSCGFNVLSHVTDPPNAAGILAGIGGTGIAASNGFYYFATGDGEILCFDAAANALCGTFNVGGIVPSQTPPETATYGNLVFAAILPSPTATTTNVYCYNTTTNAACAGTWPVSPPNGIGVGGVLQGAMAPLLSTTGVLTGICTVPTNQTSFCWDLSGASVPSPYPVTAGFHVAYTGDTIYIGTKAYLPVNSGNSVGCFDFATIVGGVVQPCAGFTPPSNPTNYTSRTIPGIPGCIIATGDGRVMNTFDATTGGPCASTFASSTVNPVASYCGSGTAGFHSWNTVEISGLPSTAYGSALVTVFDNAGQPVAGFDHVTLPNGVSSLDISSIPTTGTTSSITAQVELLSVTDGNAVTAGRVAVTWDGDPLQACFQTTAPAVACNAVGTVSNDVTITTTGTGGSDTGNSSGATSFTNTNVAGACALQFAKSAAPPSVSPGGDLTYTITVQNTGTVDYAAANPATFTDDLTNVLNNAVYNDDASASAGTVEYSAPVLAWTGPLAAGATATITYTATANTTNTGSDLVNTVVSNDEGSNCTAAQPAAVCTADVPVLGLTLQKSVSPATVTTAGDSVTYSYLVTNTGSQPLDGMSVVESAADFTGTGTPPVATCPQPTLAAGASETCTATYALTQADIDAGVVNNTATAQGTAPGQQTPTVSNPSTATVTSPAAPALTLAKSVTPGSVTAAGDTVTYSYVVTNNGNVTLSAMTIVESSADFTGTGTLPVATCPQPALGPGESETCTAPYTLTQADIDAGSVDNTATAQGTAPGAAAPTDSNPSSAEVLAPAAPALTLAKSVAPATVSSVGDIVVYSYLVTNTGNVTLDSVGVVESAADFTGTGPLPTVVCPQASLAPGASETCTANYSATQADVDAGVVENTATAQGTPPGATTPTLSTPSSAEFTATATPAITLQKSATPATVVAAGDTVTYSYLVTNTGNVTLSAISVTESAADFTGTGTLPAPTCPQSSLASGQSQTCTASYTVTQADVNAGSISNMAVVEGTAPGANTPTVSAPSSAVVTASPVVGIALVKSVDPGTLPPAGTSVTYRYAVTNTGTVPLSSIQVMETAAGFSGTGSLPVPVCPVTTLDPGVSTTCTADYVVTAADAAAGMVTNTATAQGLAPGATTPTGSTPSTAVLESVLTPETPQPPTVNADLAGTGSRLGLAGILVAAGLILTGAALVVSFRLRRRSSEN